MGGPRISVANQPISGDLDQIRVRESSIADEVYVGGLRFQFHERFRITEVSLLG